MIVVLLPGMPGAGELFQPFVNELPPHVTAVTFSYPAGARLTYDQLADRVSRELPLERPDIIVAESYSGPIALALAARAIGDLRAVVLVASFAEQPLGLARLWLARLPQPFFERRRHGGFSDGFSWDPMRRAKSYQPCKRQPERFNPTY
jgi:pimeloyl-ACP methyl ester carboxylesterase